MLRQIYNPVAWARHSGDLHLSASRWPPQATLRHGAFWILRSEGGPHGGVGLRWNGYIRRERRDTSSLFLPAAGLERIDPGIHTRRKLSIDPAAQASIMSTPDKRTGSCLCKMVKLEMTGSPIFTNNCHCIPCQKKCAAAFTSNVFYNEDVSQVPCPGKGIRGEQRGSRRGSRIEANPRAQPASQVHAHGAFSAQDVRGHDTRVGQRAATVLLRELRVWG